MFPFLALFRTRPRIQVFDIPFVNAGNHTYKLPQPPIEQALIGLSLSQKKIIQQSSIPEDVFNEDDQLVRTIKLAHLYLLINEYHRSNQRSVTKMCYAADLLLLSSACGMFNGLLYFFFQWLGT